MRGRVLSWIGACLCATTCGTAAATEVVFVAPAATFAVPTVVGAVVTPQIAVVPHAVVVPQIVTQLVVVQTVPTAVVVRQRVRVQAGRCGGFRSFIGR